eukprot:TRINITY_DN8681_c0_g1_i2.p1 TRINITY_DN8681_c0_g1~~TRINITY_DN8681_c0_g1_i2.p1  ORF type:complete len:340 (+),score=74.33 TRINITY_DN8681_c0_g1_i2:447-1466(+)
MIGMQRGFFSELKLQLGYLTRPIWDQKSNRMFELIPHYYSENQNITKREWCEMHGWRQREGETRKVIDVLIFSIELDLLEIRLRELNDHVDLFIIIETDITFTGKTKELHFENNKERFQFAKHKIIQHSFKWEYIIDFQDPFVQENHLRSIASQKLREHVRIGDLVIMSDVDEIPSSHTILLLKSCQGFPHVLHLQMTTFIYSFEFTSGELTWRPSIHTWEENDRYVHSSSSPFLLSNSGWHCTFCFPKIEHFVFKMNAYSHADRVRYPHFLNPERIQKKICNGEDLFDMLPESYSFRDLISRWGPAPRSRHTVNLPKHLIENFSRFKWLLPGGCIRDK